MKEQDLKRLRSQFISIVGHLLADEGVRHWQGEAAAHITAPKDRILCLNSSGVVQDLCLHAFDPGKVARTVDLTRLKMNWGYRLPSRVRELRPTARGMKLELTCRASDLLELVPTVADLMLGRAELHRDYLWDYRATEGLLPETREWFRRLGFLKSLSVPEATNSVAKLFGQSTQEAISLQTQWKLAKADSEAFAEGLTSLKPPAERLVQAAQRYRSSRTGGFRDRRR